jgi:subtilisin-like proprotein convertase family protein
MLRTVTVTLLALLLAAGSASAQEPTPLPAAPGGEAEPNDTPETATPIAAGERIRATRAAGEVDLYRFTAEAGDRVFAAVVVGGDPRLALLASDGATVIETDNNDGSLGPQSSTIAGATIPAAGTYYLRVDSPQANVPVVEYELYLDVQSGLDSGTRAADEVDRFAVELEPGDTVFASLDLDPERDGQSFNGRLTFAGQVPFTVDNGRSDGPPSEAYAGTVSVAGVYDLLVDAAAADATGTYQLSITVIGAVERGCRTYSIAPQAGEIPDLGVATFPIVVPDAATIDHAALRFDLTHAYMRDLDASLQSPSGNLIGLFNDTGVSTRMLTLFDENAAGTQYDAVTGVGLRPLPAGTLGLIAGQPAAGTWTLTLRDDAPDDVGTLARADLILCARPEEGSVETVFSAGFEAGDDGFTHSGAGDEWERGTPANVVDVHLAGLDRCAEGSGCLKTDLDGSYDANSSQDLVSPPISLAGRSGRIVASWAMWYQLEADIFDRFTVSVEEVGGANARPLFTWSGGDMWATQGAGPPVALAYSAGWGRHRADVSDYAGKTIQLRFHLASDADFEGRGVAIDDVRVHQPVPVAPVEDPPAASPPAGVVPAAAAEELAISDLRLGSRCVRRTSTGRVRVPLFMRLAQPGAVRVRVDRAVGSGNRSTCPRANPERNQRFRRVATFRPVAKVRAASVPRRVELDLRLRPGLYRLTVRVRTADGRLSPAVRRFLRVVG